MKKLLVIIILLTIIGVELSAQEYAIVSSKKINNISLGQLKAIFLKKNSYIEDKKVIPLNLSSRNKIRMSFEKNVLHMSFAKLKSYWTKQHYLGHRPPITMKSEKSIKAFLHKVEYSIGYMKIENVDKDLNILYKWSD